MRYSKAFLMMARFSTIILVGVLAIMADVIAFADTGASLPKTKRFSYEGHIFFNATNSATQGEKYLLNQQLSNIKLGSELWLTDWNKMKGLLIFNTLPTPVAPQLYFEQLYDEFKIRPSNAYIEVGKKWLNFGSYKNDLIYKPLTKALGQTSETTLVLGYDNFHYVNVSFFEPFSRIQFSSLPLYYNVNIGAHNNNFDVGGSYLYSFAESQLLQYNKGFGGFLAQPLKNRVPGLASYFNIKYKKFNTYISYVAAIRPFALEDLSYNFKRATPKAFSIQSGYDFQIKSIPSKFIGFYDHSFQALALRVPQQRAGVGLSLFPSRYLSLQFQYFKDFGYGDYAIAGGLNHFVSGRHITVNNFALQAILNF